MFETSGDGAFSGSVGSAEPSGVVGSVLDSVSPAAPPGVVVVVSETPLVVHAKTLTIAMSPSPVDARIGHSSLIPSQVPRAAFACAPHATRRHLLPAAAKLDNAVARKRSLSKSESERVEGRLAWRASPQS